MSKCYKYQDVSNILYHPCRHFADLFSHDLWHHLLWGDYLAFTAVACLGALTGYRSYRGARWRRLCGQHTGLRHDDGADPKSGKPLYSYAKIRIKRSHLFFGEVRSVTVYGLDTVTPANVTAARAAISNYVGVELSDPPATGVGAVVLDVNHLVAKKNSFARRLGL